MACTIAKAAKTRKFSGEGSLGAVRGTLPDVDASESIALAWGERAASAIEGALEEAARAQAGRVFFDWDNTVIRGDVGDLVMLELLERAPLGLPAHPGAWGPLTELALARLEDAFGGRRLVEVGEPRRARVESLLCDLVWSEELDPGVPAFTVTRTRAFRGGYFAMAAMVDALAPEARGELALAAFERASMREVGDRVSVGSHGYEVERFARVREPMAALRQRAREHGLEVWVVSASHEDAVRAVAERVGFEPNRVIGARPSWSASTFPSLEGAPVMTYDEGKRAAIAHLVEGVPASDALSHRPRVAIAVGDSDTDHAMLEDASSLLVLVDRGQPKVSALARAREAEGRVGVVRVPH